MTMFFLIIKKIKHVLRLIYVDRLVIYLKSFYFFIIHGIFLIIKNKSDFKIKFKGNLIVVFYDNYVKYINKPVWIRLLDNTYEEQEIKSIKKYLKRDMNVLELGGSLGVTSVIINSILKNKKNHIVCEANPNLLENLEFNRKLNNSKFDIINKPVSNEEKVVSFNYNQISLGGSIFDKSSKYMDDRHGQYNCIKTKTISPLQIEKKNKIVFDCLICDIEGEEYNLLLNLLDYFNSFKLMIVEFHYDDNSSQENFKKIKQVYSKNFTLKIINHNNIIFLNKNHFSS